SDYCVRLKGGRCMGARAVVLASGMQYRRLPLANLEQFEGRGVYYGATPLEAQLCAGAKVAVVGAGNSAGQGAMFLAQTAAEVHVLYRRPDIRETMSEYLVSRLESLPNVFLHPETEIEALKGCEERLRKIGCRVGEDGERELDTPFVFLFIGAKPCSDWLPASIARDASGFISTGPALTPRDLVKAGWSLERMPTLYETSWPRVYAVGDVRAGSVKRVASAVGEGSVCVQFIHQALAER
ncbi:MAG: NAD(P)/FAD-dependent oxidoreductase, partial [Hyphomonadaceae bacterium]|nr:NAD(P)/FAD-dependent oxidoreductase [Hyphomonadaceae bacterium]